MTMTPSHSSSDSSTEAKSEPAIERVKEVLPEMRTFSITQFDQQMADTARCHRIKWEWSDERNGYKLIGYKLNRRGREVAVDLGIIQ